MKTEIKPNEMLYYYAGKLYRWRVQYMEIVYEFGKPGQLTCEVPESSVTYVKDEVYAADAGYVTDEAAIEVLVLPKGRTVLFEE